MGGRRKEDQRRLAVHPDLPDFAGGGDRGRVSIANFAGIHDRLVRGRPVSGRAVATNRAAGHWLAGFIRRHYRDVCDHVQIAA